MANPFLGVRIPPELEGAIADRMAETGESKSAIVVAALQAYLGTAPCRERLSAIEQRLGEVEALAAEIKQLQEHQQSPPSPPHREGGKAERSHCP